MKLFNFNSSKTSATVQDIPEPVEVRWKPSDDLLDVLKKNS